MASTTLSDTQLIILTNAGKRDDGLVLIPPTLKGAAMQKVVGALLKRGFVKESKGDACVTMPGVWRRDGDHGYALFITNDGRRAIGIDPVEAKTPNVDDTRSDPKAGSKKATILSLLSRPEGASMDLLLSTTGWLPHTMRAALSRLRADGHALERTRTDHGTVYRVG